MKLQELKANQSVNVGISWGKASSESTTKVVKVAGDTVILVPFNYKGLDLDLSSGSSPDMSFSLFCVDPSTGNRVGWEDMEFSTITENGQLCYAVKIKEDGHDSVDSERRKEQRMLLDIPGIIPSVNITESVPITIHDLSTSGISVLVPSDYKPSGSILNIAFSDIVNNDAFVIPMQCNIIREVPQPIDLLKTGSGTTLYGCTISKAGESLITYLLAKRTVQK